MHFSSEEDVHNLIERFVNGEAIDVFHKISLNRALHFLDTQRYNKVLLAALEKDSKITIPYLSEVKRFPQNNYILQQNINISLGASSQFYAVIKSLAISRKGPYTCPVKSLMVFISEEFIDVTDGVFDIFNNIKSYDDLKALILHDPKTPAISKYFISENGEYCEFEPSNLLPISPIVWVNFTLHNIKIKLQRCFAGRFIYAKLIYPDDFREGRHAGVNIDCRYILPYGNIINLGQEYNN